MSDISLEDEAGQFDGGNAKYPARALSNSRAQGALRAGFRPTRRAVAPMSSDHHPTLFVSYAHADRIAVAVELPTLAMASDP